MNRALYAAASGMAAQQQNLEIIAGNLANAGVSGFKGSEEAFEPLVSPAGGSLGTAPLGARTILTQGKLERSEGAFDLAIDGTGFFQLRNEKGERAYTRDGEFARGPDGTLRNAQGWRLEGVRLPRDAASATVAPDGTVTAHTALGARLCGHIRLAEFPAPEFLRTAGGTLFFATPASGNPRTLTPGSAHGPSIRFGMLEQSNVTIVVAMMEILAAQRAYEANAKGVQAADEMMRIANNLSRS